MTWSLLIMDLPPDLNDWAILPDTFVPAKLGRRVELAEQITAILPSIDFSDPSTGWYQTEDVSIEFVMGDEEYCDGIMAQVHTGGDGGAMDILAQVLKTLGQRGIDCQTGALFTPDRARESYRAWRAAQDPLDAFFPEGMKEEDRDRALGL